MMKKYALVSMGLMLSGCLMVSPVVSGSLPTGAERLHSLTFSATSLDIQVKSFGCTKAEDFRVQTDNNNELTIIRKKADRCRAMPRIIDLQLPLPELAEGDVYIKNAFFHKR
mgnify:CR=1 FL=1